MDVYVLFHNTDVPNRAAEYLEKLRETGLVQNLNASLLARGFVSGSVAESALPVIESLPYVRSVQRPSWRQAMT